LNSEESAADLLGAASSLRQATDDYIKTRVFINADLSPAAAKLAYESRKRRLENLKRHGAVKVESIDQANDEYTPSGSGLNQQPTDSSSNVITTVNTMSNSIAGTVNPVITAIRSASGVVDSALGSNRPADSSIMRAVDLPTDGLLAIVLVASNHHTSSPFSNLCVEKPLNLITCVLLNARSVNNKLPELYNLLDGMNYGIVIVTESWLRSSTPDGLLVLVLQTVFLIRKINLILCVVIGNLSFQVVAFVYLYLNCTVSPLSM